MSEISVLNFLKTAPAQGMFASALDRELHYHTLLHFWFLKLLRSTLLTCRFSNHSFDKSGGAGGAKGALAWGEALRSSAQPQE
jgi:hypothetical protein